MALPGACCAGAGRWLAQHGHRRTRFPRRRRQLVGDGEVQGRLLVGVVQAEQLVDLEQQQPVGLIDSLVLRLRLRHQQGNEPRFAGQRQGCSAALQLLQALQQQAATVGIHRQQSGQVKAQRRTLGRDPPRLVGDD